MFMLKQNQQVHIPGNLNNPDTVNQSARIQDVPLYTTLTFHGHQLQNWLLLSQASDDSVCAPDRKRLRYRSCY